MCGIIGVVGTEDVGQRVFDGLKRLEYRGYDSAGIATLVGGAIVRRRAEGKLEALRQEMQARPLSGNLGFGHTRWATHGPAIKANAHPHRGEHVAVVHNGIIENSTILKKHLINKGHVFKSQTDTEVIVHLITENLKISKLQEAITKTLKQLHGSFALGIIFKDMPNLIVGARRGSPLAVGYGPSENYLGSDSYALRLPDFPKGRKYAGSKIWVYYKNDSVQLHELNIGSGYLSQSAPIVFLGNKNNIEKVVVQWTDGSINNIDMNKNINNVNSIN